MGLSGILFGLAAALSQSASYVFSRLAVIRGRGAVLHLLVASHLFMGLASVVALPFVWPEHMPPLRSCLLHTLGVAGFYLVGQVALFRMMRRANASRVAPLLGLKIVVLAVITTTVLNRPLAGTQWLAVFLCAAAAVVLSLSGGSLPRSSLLWLVVACTGYSLSDLSIAGLVRSLEQPTILRASIVGTCITYTLCGVGALLVLPWSGGWRALAGWRYSAPFALFWLLGMLFLFTCFGLIGAVFGNILQSTRGIISIVLGVYLARLGLLHIEQKVARGVLVRRVAAAALMCAAIWLFQAGSAAP